ncbi:branched-chain amino acid aminotransferase [Bradyrhizobium sp. CIR48]|uniref:aminotransferase class IV n=1 Tax=unclassified Bradyrhizobium TaxID=2631580 RepID=UPI0016068817|nr:MULTISPECIES: aminotransferase class IV [unclassified Bradyrhizobium]MBB4364981.1 branched-chain amino acid aminotransferase [Bradyrhizobium sp. CIR18]MBB4394659.1 branched-chain amino acid aminotransferase [Bradyrhizobium sp. ERR14]MBB4424908.1 branched-chain amino acid aminotransferase [Bradyrhizobium sp. CIR48]
MATEEANQRTLVWPQLPHSNRRPIDSRFEKGAAYVAGEFCPIEEATLPLLDWGFLRSDACQETISTWNGQFFRLQDHLDRFERSLKRLRMESPETIGRIREIAHRLVAICGYSDAYVQIIMTRGRPPIGSRDIRLCKNRFQAFCIPYMWLAKPEVQQKGLSLFISRRVRVPSVSVDPFIKHYHWLDFEMSLFDGFDAGADTVVLVDLNGKITEGPGFNLFADIDGRLVTPSTGVLDGMTRRTTLELCEEMGIAAAAGSISETQLLQSNEIFLTSTAGGIIPITSIGERTVGDGRPGPKTVQLHRAYWSRRAAGWLGEPVRYDIAP